jgi:hypothetical protein
VASWIFTLNHVDEGLPQWNYDPLLRRLKLAQGISIVERPQGTFRALRFPTQDDIATAANFYQGGHQYTVDDTTKANLIAGGVNVTSANFVPA